MGEKKSVRLLPCLPPSTAREDGGRRRPSRVQVHFRMSGKGGGNGERAARRVIACSCVHVLACVSLVRYLSLSLLEPHSHMWVQNTLIISSLSPKRDWGPKIMRLAGRDRRICVLDCLCLYFFGTVHMPGLYPWACVGVRASPVVCARATSLLIFVSCMCSVCFVHQACVRCRDRLVLSER